MSDCCSSSSCSSNSRPKKYRCPVNGKAYPAVSSTTIKHHIAKPWRWKQKDQVYYFCSDPECEVVYFGEDDSIIKKSGLRTSVGIKENSPEALICYCFGVTQHDAVNNPEIREFVLQETKDKNCACEIRNPSGKCCLKDFPKPKK